MRYIIFSRVSTKMQDVQNQVKECVEYVNTQKRDGDEVIRIDEPETSSRIPMENRIKLQKMLDTVKKGDTLVIYKLDRLARDGEELVYIYRSKLIKKGVKIVSLYEPHIDNANIHIYAFLGETERNNIRIRTISGLKKKQANMEKVGTCWYGYTTDPTKLQLHKERTFSFGKPYLLIPEEKEAQQVEIMWELFHQGYSYGQIACELESKGYKNRAGNPVSKMTVYRVLQRLKTQRQAPMVGSFR